MTRRTELALYAYALAVVLLAFCQVTQPAVAEATPADAARAASQNSSRKYIGPSPHRSCSRANSAPMFSAVVFQHHASIFGTQACLLGCEMLVRKLTGVSVAFL